MPMRLPPADRVGFFAEVSVRRAASFAVLGIGTTAMSLIFDPPMALRIASALTAIMATAFALKALQAPVHPYRRTEVWILLEKRLELPEERRQRLIGQTLRRVYVKWARRSAVGAAALWGSAILISMASDLVGRA